VHRLAQILLRAVLYVFPPPPPHPRQDDLMALADCLWDDNTTIPLNDLDTIEIRKARP